ncbi:hypothetical protein QNM99_21385 [Pseudomonas sp. PCH446]
MMFAVWGYGWVGYSFFEKPVLDRATSFCKRRFRTASSANRPIRWRTAGEDGA